MAGMSGQAPIDWRLLAPLRRQQLILGRMSRRGERASEEAPPIAGSSGGDDSVQK